MMSYRTPRQLNYSKPSRKELPGIREWLKKGALKITQDAT
jgi:hypothetical protein